jgi:hypothetical protein
MTMPAALASLAHTKGRFAWVIYDAGGRTSSQLDSALVRACAAVMQQCLASRAVLCLLQGSAGCWRHVTAGPAGPPCSGKQQRTAPPQILVKGVCSAGTQSRCSAVTSCGCWVQGSDAGPAVHAGQPAGGPGGVPPKRHRLPRRLPVHLHWHLPRRAVRPHGCAPPSGRRIYFSTVLMDRNCMMHAEGGDDGDPNIENVT